VSSGHGGGTFRRKYFKEEIAMKQNYGVIWV
jgi:hypothetical protein